MMTDFRHIFSNEILCLFEMLEMDISVNFELMAFRWSIGAYLTQAMLAIFIYLIVL